jgi:hypothetical protein
VAATRRPRTSAARYQLVEVRQLAGGCLIWASVDVRNAPVTSNDGSEQGSETLRPAPRHGRSAAGSVRRTRWPASRVRGQAVRGDAGRHRHRGVLRGDRDSCEPAEMMAVTGALLSARFPLVDTTRGRCLVHPSSRGSSSAAEDVVRPNHALAARRRLSRQ